MNSSTGGDGPRACEERLYPHADPLGYEGLLSDAERAVLFRLRAMLETEVAPLINEHWDSGQFPDEIRGPLEKAQLMDPPELAGVEPSALYSGFRMFELARTDVSVAVFYGAQATLFRHSILRGGSREQIDLLDTKIRSWAIRGVFALTEPDHGSDVARGLETVARREGEEWILSGAKRWIGGAADADYVTVIAKDEADSEAKAFLVDRRAEGVTVEEISQKIAVRIINNGHITLSGVRVPESQRLQHVNSFEDVSRMLRSMRADVAWMAAGAQAGAFEAAVRYVSNRRQFGRPIASFQLVQDKLATMLGNLTASLGMAVQLSRLEDAGGFRNQDAALVKSWTARQARETVSLARELAGGNGITLATDVARFFADAEAIYTFEGTNDINQLVVGRSITGISAFL